MKLDKRRYRWLTLGISGVITNALIGFVVIYPLSSIGADYHSRHSKRVARAGQMTSLMLSAKVQASSTVSERRDELRGELAEKSRLQSLHLTADALSKECLVLKTQSLALCDNMEQAKAAIATLLDNIWPVYLASTKSVRMTSPESWKGDLETASAAFLKCAVNELPSMSAQRRIALALQQRIKNSGGAYLLSS